MAILKVNPTRMELRRLKNRLKTAERGHKLLKDKSDEMVRQFMLMIKENRRLRISVEAELQEALNAFLLAKAVSNEAVILESLMMPARQPELLLSSQNIMSLNVPKMTLKTHGGEELFPYAFSQVTSELDDAVRKISGLTDRLLQLAEVEKACNMLAVEIEKNKRRVNALEYIMIPQIEETISFISMKLDENERSNIVRLMKVKSIIGDREK